jgi:sulfite exporter TauE/SafE/copper chaperone CopZ
MTKQIKDYNFHVNGMHCKACTVLIEEKLSELPEVKTVHVNLNTNSLQIRGVLGNDTEKIANNLSKIILPHGYEITTLKTKKIVQWKDFYIAGPIAIGFILLFLLLQKAGIVNLYSPSDIGYSSAFIIGLIASVSTCMAVVGGLALSVSANYSKEGSKLKPQVMFHVARLVSFFILGGAIGVLGSMFKIGALGTLVISLAISFVLIILGLNLIDSIPWAKKLQPSMPAIFGHKITKLKNVNNTLMPLLLGALTFFLPCGFTQAMQLFTLSTGSFMVGGLTMLAFALGTLPVLALLSFSSLGIKTKTQSSIFFKSAGLVVIFFGIFNLINALVAFGLIAPVFNF